MTPSPESRARELLELLKGIRWPAEAEAVPLIAAAIRDAENDALERAAALADPPLMHRKGAPGLWRQRRAQMAAEIRSLKHPKD